MLQTSVRLSDYEHKLITEYSKSYERSINNIIRQLVRSLADKAETPEPVETTEPAECEIKTPPEQFL